MQQIFQIFAAVNPVHRIIGFCLLAAFIFQVSGKVIILADYCINKDFIADVLCVNKDKPKLHCEGKCHLTKQLEKEEKNQKVPFGSKEDKHEVQLFAEKKNVFNFFSASLSGQNVLPYEAPVSGRHLHSVFHPPKV